MTVPTGLVDLHNHLVPGVDDGARDLEEAMLAVGRLAQAGVRHVIATPHLRASLLEHPEAFTREHERVEAAWRTVVDGCRGRAPALTFHLGHEVALDTPAPDLSDPRARLAGGPYALVEFPRLAVPPRSEDALIHVSAHGHVPVVAHVERYRYDTDRERVLLEWRAAGAAFQVNAPSLVGKYGPDARTLAWDLLERGWVDVVASDHHARGEPWIAEALAAMAERGGTEQAEILYKVNPGRILAGRPLEAVPPIEPGGSWLGRFLRGARRRAARPRGRTSRQSRDDSSV